jgi:HPt (histidine-containing phosphotransfer) domain-containing protein
MSGDPRDNPKWLARFKPEAARHLVELIRGLEHLQPKTLVKPPNLKATFEEITRTNPELRELYRLAHTLKGSAGMVGQTEIAEYAEQIERDLTAVLFDPDCFDEDLRRKLVNLTEQTAEKVKQIGQD